MRLLRALVSALTLLGAAHAQPAAPLSTDRPDFTESPAVVPLGSVQAEFGATLDRTAGRAAVSGPELLVRVGVARRAEVRLVAPGVVATRGASGVTSPSVGVKVALGRVGAWAVGAIGEVLVPVGSASQSSRRLDPALVVTAARSLPGGAEVGAQVGATADLTGRRVTLAATLVGGVAVAERTGAFLELAADGLDARPGLVLHTGATHRLAPLVQVDLHGGVGLTGTAPAFLVGAGLSVRR